MTTKLEVPKELLDKHREVNVDHGWWEHVYDVHQEKLAEIGFFVSTDNMHFSGFWCQGDGASFTGRVDDWEKFWPAIDPTGEQYPMLRREKDGDLDLKLVRLDYRYSHEYTVTCEVYASDYDDDTDCEATNAIRAAWNGQLHKELPQLENDAKDFLRGKMRELYRDLEKEYEYLTSDEQVADYVREFCPEELEEYWADEEAA